jgi:hypothetical protein
VSASKYESWNPYFWYQSGFGFDFDILDAEFIPVHLSEVWGVFLRRVNCQNQDIQDLRIYRMFA